MHSIQPPRKLGPYPGRHLECQERLAMAFRSIQNSAIAAGWTMEETATALVELADKHALLIMACAAAEATMARMPKRQ